MAEQHRQGFYDACDGKGWQKCDEGLSVQDSTRRDDDAWHAEMKRWGDSARPAFVVGQTISTLAEYEALPVGATVWPLRRTVNDPWHWVRDAGGYRVSDREPSLMGLHTPLEMTCQLGECRVIRSLPSEAA